MFPRKKSQRFSSLANTSYPRTPTGQSLPAKNQSFWGLVMWRYKVFQRDFAMSGVSQEEMDSCVLIIRIYLYKYILYIYMPGVICISHNIHIYTYYYLYIYIYNYIYICIYISLYSYIERQASGLVILCVCRLRLHHRFEEERSSCHRSCGYLGDHQKGYIPLIHFQVYNYFA